MKKETNIGADNLRTTLRRYAKTLRNMEEQFHKTKEPNERDWFMKRMNELSTLIGHQTAVASLLGYRVTWTDYSKYIYKVAGEPHVSYVGCTPIR